MYSENIFIGFIDAHSKWCQRLFHFYLLVNIIQYDHLRNQIHRHHCLLNRIQHWTLYHFFIAVFSYKMRLRETITVDMRFVSWICLIWNTTCRIYIAVNFKFWWNILMWRNSCEKLANSWLAKQSGQINDGMIFQRQYYEITI